MPGKIRHGHAMYKNQSKTYQCWKKIRQRCQNKNCDDYEYYGGRGISVCQRWESFENFLHDMGEAPPGLTIDRIDNDGHYEPSNCRWATRRQQVLNKRGNFVRGAVGMRGERHPSSKLTANQVAEIRSLKGFLSQQKIADRFGVSQSNVSMIQTGSARIWL